MGHGLGRGRCDECDGHGAAAAVSGAAAESSLALLDDAPFVSCCLAPGPTWRRVAGRET